MTSQDKNEPDKRANHNWAEDQEAILTSLNKQESGDDDNGQATDDEQVWSWSWQELHLGPIWAEPNLLNQSNAL